MTDVLIEYSGCDGATPKVMVGDAVYWVEWEDLVALREHFQSERDEQLGRWRWPENTDVYVHPWANTMLAVVDERTAHRALFERRDTGLLNDAGQVSDYVRAARAFLDAHPEPKPWHEAASGEAWELTLDGETFVAVCDIDSGFYATPAGYRFFPVDDKRVTAGRRIWPEATS